MFSRGLAALVGTFGIATVVAASGCTPQHVDQTIAGLHVVLDADAHTLVVDRAGTVLSRIDLATVRIGHGTATTDMQFGMFDIEEDPRHDVTVDRVKLDTVSDGSVSFTLFAHDTPMATGHVFALNVGVPTQELPPLLVQIDASDTTANRISLATDCVATDHFVGLGAQSFDVDQRGQIVPLWVSEQGIGKTDNDDLPTLWQLTGRRHTSYLPMPAMVTSRGSAFLVNTPTFARFDVCKTVPSEVRFEAWDHRLALVIFGRDDVKVDHDDNPVLRAQRELSAFVGRPHLPPPWAFGNWNDAIFGEQHVLDVATALRAKHIPSSAIWTEDWRGGEDDGASYRLHENWDVDRTLYPNFETMTSSLATQGFATLVYFNTFVTQGADIFDTFTTSGFTIHDDTDAVLLFPGSSKGFAPASLVDLENPAAREAVKAHLKAALALGVKGWMADFGEWLPVDHTKLHSGQDPAREHNLYPLEWQQLNNDALSEAGVVDDSVVFVRSGWLGSQAQANIVWLGDQRTDFERDDGMPSVIPMGIGLGAVGFPFVTHDVAGYQSATNPGVTKELFFRWTELGAFTSVLRTHHGTSARSNYNLFSDDDATAHYKRYADLHIRLYPYLRALAHRAVAEGAPLWMPMSLLFPDDVRAWTVDDEVFLGDALLVAPVQADAARSRTVHVPAGRFVPFLDVTPSVHDAIVGPVDVTIDADLGDIPVLVRAGGIVPLTAEPADTLQANVTGLRDLSSTEGDRTVFVALGRDGHFVEESGASYTLTGTGTTPPTSSEPDGAVVVHGNDVVTGTGFTFTLAGHPTARTTRVIFR